MAYQRYSDPVILQQVWKAIAFIRGQKQIANISRITKIIRKEASHTPKEVLHHIHRAVKDSMVVETLSMGCKGSKAGKEQEGYWVPDDLISVDLDKTHDCYCFICHKPGMMLRCSSCPKSYHKKCLDSDEEPHERDPTNVRKWLCKYCQSTKVPQDVCSPKKRKLNKCLQFITDAMLEAAPELADNPSPRDFKQYNYFIKQHKTLGDMKKSCQKFEFNSEVEFRCAMDLILHNCRILLEEENELNVSARKMVERGELELKELQLCINCYFMSNSKPAKNWFCTPCKPPHKLVWAKQKGFEYWPAKVIQIKDEKADVRFFGGHHERAWVGEDGIKGLQMSPAELQIKITKSWIRANDEMKEYIRQTEIMYGSKDASKIILFDQQCLRPQKEKVKLKRAANFENEELNKRYVKHQEEILLYKKKRKLQKPVDSEQILKIQCVDSDRAVDVETVGDSSSSNTLPAWRKELKVFGPRAKLMEECARTWPYAKQLIKDGILRQGFKPESCIPENTDEQTEQMQTGESFQSPKAKDSGQAECNCRQHYEQVLQRYKMCARRMLRREKEEIVSVSTIYIQRLLRNKEKRLLELEKENEELKKELEDLRASMKESSTIGSDAGFMPEEDFILVDSP